MFLDIICVADRRREIEGSKVEIERAVTDLGIHVQLNVHLRHRRFLKSLDILGC